ncbi:MAG TPA: HD domain-containing protein [Candidatus Pacearchaeota archaeon]|nr:putative hydrolase [archaeon BMS3Abin17]HDK42810.1 HD domain-containing protein [Candidatus Pacearchaeota archaeon]HDZ60318.1 HD domain-containing protein [Candidatus Pacearchaeota archaeon]
MDENIVEQIRKFVEEECKKPSSKYGYEIYPFHFVLVHKYSKLLAEKFKADVEIVELAAWLHDVGSIIFGRDDHHLTSAKIAEKKLKELNYSKEKIERVKHCILNHRGSQLNKRKSREAQIVADADAMTHFDNISGIFMAAFLYENKNQGEAQDEVREKLIRSYNKISSEAQNLIKPKYNAAMLLLK